MSTNTKRTVTLEYTAKTKGEEFCHGCVFDHKDGCLAPEQLYSDCWDGVWVVSKGENDEQG